MIGALRSRTMQNLPFPRSLVASLILTFAAGSALGAEAEHSLKVDAVAPLTTYWSSLIVEASTRHDAWSLFVAPELIVRDYEISSFYDGYPVRQVSVLGLGIWSGFGYRPSREDYSRGMRIGLSLRARRIGADIASRKDGMAKVEDVDSFLTIVSKRRETTSSAGVSSEFAYASFPFGGSDFLRKSFVEPYMRLGLRSDWIETTAFEGGDRVPGTSSRQEWNRDFRMGLFLGRVF
jgi:hypothetical protein